MEINKTLRKTVQYLITLITLRPLETFQTNSSYTQQLEVSCFCLKLVLTAPQVWLKIVKVIINIFNSQVKV